jgi:hypothetical protein
MKKIVLIILFIGTVISNEVRDEKDKNSTESSMLTEEVTTTIQTEIENSSQHQMVESSSIKEIVTSTSEKVSTSTDFEDSSFEIDNPSPVNPQSPNRKKILYINQQQSGKLNVHLELNDVSVVVIPNRNDPQLSLLSLLLKSAQKSNNLKNEMKKKEENLKLAAHHDDDYSKYKLENYFHSSTNEPIIESRAPYHVDISSNLGQHSDNSQSNIFVNGEASSPLLKLLKPATIQPSSHHSKMYKRSIDTRVLGINPNVLSDTSISSNHDEEEELTESFVNSLDNENENLNIAAENGSEFILLGAVENCGPGRKRNSYQICVSVDEK